MKQAAKRRIICAGLFAALLFTEIMIGMYAHGFLRAYIGDVLVMPAMFFLVRIFTDRLPRLLTPMLFIFACAVEVSQHFMLYRLLGFERGSLMAVLMGTSFAWEDILCYAAGSVINLLSEGLLCGDPSFSRGKTFIFSCALPKTFDFLEDSDEEKFKADCGYADSDMGTRCVERYDCIRHGKTHDPSV